MIQRQRKKLVDEGPGPVSFEQAVEPGVSLVSSYVVASGESAMERRDVVLTVTLIALVIILALVMAAAALFWFNKRRRSKGFDEDGESPSHSDDSKMNGAVSLSTPLIKTKAVAHQLSLSKQPHLNNSEKSQSCESTPVKRPDHPAKAFWQTKSLSSVDMYVDTSEPTETVGHIQFSLEYDFSASTLVLKIIQQSFSESPVPRDHRTPFTAFVFAFRVHIDTSINIGSETPEIAPEHPGILPVVSKIKFFKKFWRIDYCR
ncbi:unnamed protein product [Cyprideis torosa]|uniref:Uncharacterized protein n=1 Tax=Cyprideis torosa TaxID=163714 RepID=A0A7R8W8S3_9CRUS|nr:unnamed protein product [Cyprideis torosa]CAG0888898.1 unnamed protein product [Cyprideis torosa]